MPSHKWLLDKFLYARNTCTFGDQNDYFDHANTIGGTFSGDITTDQDAWGNFNCLDGSVSAWVSDIKK